MTYLPMMLPAAITLSSVVAFALIALTVAAALALVIVYFFSNLRKETQDALSETNDQLKIQLDLRDSTISVMQTKAELQDQTIHHQAEQIATQDRRITELREDVTQRADVASFRNEVRDWFEQASAKMDIAYVRPTDQDAEAPPPRRRPRPRPARED